MKTTDSAMREKLGEIREQLKDRITEAYFIFSKFETCYVGTYKVWRVAK